MKSNNQVQFLGRVRPKMSLEHLIPQPDTHEVQALNDVYMPSIRAVVHHGDGTLSSAGADFFASHSSSLSQITEYLYVGDVTAGRTAHEHGITHVINCIAGHECGNYPKQPGLHYLDIAMRDSTSYDISQDFTRTISFISTAREEGGRVLVHCQAGISRSVTIALAYLMAEEPRFNYSFESAFSYVASKRHQVSPNLGFIIALGDFEKKLQEKNAQSHRQEASSTAAAAAAEYHQTGPISPELRVYRSSTPGDDARVEGAVEEVAVGVGTCPALSFTLPLYRQAATAQRTSMDSALVASVPCSFAQRATL